MFRGSSSDRITSRTNTTSGKLSSASRRLKRVVRVSCNPLGDCEEEGCAMPWFRFNPDSSAIALNHALANGQPDTSTAIFFVVMQPLEQTKNLLLIPWIDPNSIVLDREAPKPAVFNRRDMYLRRRLVTVLQGIGD